ncbi:MAG TPA: hypothetical protein VK753_08950 [Xanthomonadaceae bacterium]|nr:hypothetical protein [Xanthomonadaceae bacterium]
MFRAYRVFSLLRPARPRHPIVQALFALFAVCAFLILLVVGAGIAIFAVLVGTLLRAFGFGRPVGFAAGSRPGAQANAPADTHTADGDVIDGEFRVVDKSLPQGSGR